MLNKIYLILLLLLWLKKNGSTYFTRADKYQLCECYVHTWKISCDNEICRIEKPKGIHKHQHTHLQCNKELAFKYIGSFMIQNHNNNNDTRSVTAIFAKRTLFFAVRSDGAKAIHEIRAKS